MGFNIGTKIVKATGGSISRVGSHRIHQFPGEYVTDGLCLYVDTAHHDSLDILNESGHDAGTIYDLSGNKVDGKVHYCNRVQSPHTEAYQEEVIPWRRESTFKLLFSFNFCKGVFQ